jgi:hypothetical protein
MHEQSETVQLPNGRWVNVYGKALPSAGMQLPNSVDYGSMDEATAAARARSESYGTPTGSRNTFGERMMGKAKEFHESMNLRNLANKFDVEGLLKGVLRPYRQPSSPSRNLDETHQLEELERLQRESR